MFVAPPCPGMPQNPPTVNPIIFTKLGGNSSILGQFDPSSLLIGGGGGYRGTNFNFSLFEGVSPVPPDTPQHPTVWGFLKRGYPESSILMGFPIVNHPFWGSPIYGNTHIPPIISSSKPHGLAAVAAGVPRSPRASSMRPRTTKKGWIHWEKWWFKPQEMDI